MLLHFAALLAVREKQRVVLLCYCTLLHYFLLHHHWRLFGITDYHTLISDQHFWTADIKQLVFSWQCNVDTSLGGTHFD